MCSFFVWLLTRSIITLRLGHTVASINVLPFLLPRNTPQCTHTTLCIHSPLMDSLGLLPIKLLCTHARTYAFVALADMPRSGVAGSTGGGVCLHLKETARLSSQVATPPDTPTSSVGVPPPHILLRSVFFILALGVSGQ